MTKKQMELSIKEFSILSLNFTYIPYEAASEEEGEILNQPVEVDFDIQTTEKSDSIRIELDLTCNFEEEDLHPGYSYYVSCEAFFDLENAESKKDVEIDGYLLYTALPMVIDYMRGYLATISGSFPYGQYLMPIIDIDEVIENAIEKQNREEKE
ncbi:MAG TPA: hypothetical protein VFF33_03860 [Ignavibacteriaceae bacterium]|nr:hypothetical protein [Ignavibacteriaceae bacterium]